MKDLLLQYAAYNLWANTRMVERLQRERDGLMDHHVKSSFPSLGLTLAHIRDASRTWHERIFGVQGMHLGTGIDALLEVSVKLNDQVKLADEAMLMQSVSYANSRGEQFTHPRWQLLMQCFNHASHHRGQLITIMRQLDLTEIPNTDLVTYQRLLMARR